MEPRRVRMGLWLGLMSFLSVTAEAVEDASPSDGPGGRICRWDVTTDGRVIEIPCERPITQDGRCGWQFDNVACGGEWGKCCTWDGYCGTGEDFCGVEECDEGDCDWLHPEKFRDRLPWQTGTTQDGTCGGSEGWTCSIVYGRCCSQDGICGVLDEHCGEGCQREFGKCYGREQSKPAIASAKVTTPAAESTASDEEAAWVTTSGATNLQTTGFSQGVDSTRSLEQEASSKSSVTPSDESSGASRPRFGFIFT